MAELDPYDPQLMEVVAERLRDPEPWVVGCTWRVLPKFGPPAVKFLSESETAAADGELTEHRNFAKEEFAQLATDEAKLSFERSQKEHAKLAERIQAVLQAK